MAENAGRVGPRQNDPVNPLPPGMDSQKGEIPWASPEAQGKTRGTYGVDLDKGYTNKGRVDDTGGTPL